MLKRKDKVVIITGATSGIGEDVAKVVSFLASDDASYLTGLVLPIDGGVSL